MIGIDRHNPGVQLDGVHHLSQSVVDILTTPVGTMPMVRDYGSRLPELLDQPVTGETAIDLYMEAAEALDRWEPRLTLMRVSINDMAPGQMVLTIEGTDEDGEALSLPLEIGGPDAI